MQRNAEGRADVGGGKRIGDVPPRDVGRPAVTAPGGEASEPAGDVSQRDARSEDVTRCQNGIPCLTMYRRHGDRDDGRRRRRRRARQ